MSVLRRIHWSAPRSNRRHVAALILAAASWGIATAISKRAVGEIPPLTLLPIQLSTSVAALIVVMRLSGVRLRGSAVSRNVGLLGVLNPGLSYSLSLLGLVYVTASLSVLLWALEPLMILVLAWATLGERAGRRLVVLSLVAVAGMLVVLYDPGSGGQLLTDGRMLGVVLTFGGVACCAAYTVMARKLLSDGDSTIAAVTMQQVWALAFSLAALAAVTTFGLASPARDVSAEAWLSAVLSGLLYYAAAFWFYLTGLRGVSASFAAVSFYLIPVFGIAAGYVLLAERFGPSQWLGVGVVLVAVFGIISRPGQAAANASSASGA